jgi:predicted NUDIX family phosphoesterase
VLSNFLDESICVIPANSVKISLPENGFVSNPATISGFIETIKEQKRFAPRSQAEQKPNYLQPIPCALLRYDDKVLILTKAEKAGTSPSRQI